MPVHKKKTTLKLLTANRDRRVQLSFILLLNFQIHHFHFCFLPIRTSPTFGPKATLDLSTVSLCEKKII